MDREQIATRRWTLVATIVGSSLTFIDGTVVNVALPALQSDLQATIAQIQWVIEAYALFLGGLILVGGSLGDQFGRKRLFLAGVVVFTAASAVCGLAPTVGVLIAARVVQGVGAACLVPGSLAIISATFSGGDEGRAIGTWAGFSAITSALGPVVGGWLIQHFGWRSVFFLNIPLALIVIGLSVRFMNESRDSSRAPHVDWIGGALAVAGLGGIVFALLEWPNEGPTRPVLASLMLGVGSLGAFVLREHRVPDPMLRLGLFRSRTFTLANVLTLFLYGALGLALWLLPLDLIQVQHYTATDVGAALVPFPVLMFALSRWSGGLVTRVGTYTSPLTIGPLIVAGGLAFFARGGATGNYWTTVFPAVIVLGVGLGVVVAPLTTTAMTAVDPRHAGVASGVNNAVSRIGGLVAIAVFGMMLVHAFDVQASDGLDQLNLPAQARAVVDRELPRLAGADVPPAVEFAQRAAVRQAIDRAFASAFRLVMFSSAALAVLAGIAGFLIRRPGTDASR